MKIRLISKSDAKIISGYYLANTEHFKCWEPTRPFGFHSIGSWRKRVVEQVRAQESGNAAYFIAVIDNAMVGHCSLTQIVQGPFQACYMGYGVALSMQGKGIAFKICQHAISYAFQEAGLHRIMANYMPHNNRSAKLLSRLGFVKEGMAKDYLKIAGQWQNHVLTSLTNTRSA